MRRASTLRLALLALTWGSSFLWIALALPMLAPSWLTIIRLVLGSTLLLTICRLHGYPLPRGRSTWTRLTVAGLISNVAPYFLFAVGEDRTSSAYAGIINGTTPLWTALAVLALSRRTPPRLQIVGLAVGLLGTLFIFEPWRQTGPGSLAGIAACLAAAALYGLSYVYMARYVAPQPYNTIALATGQLATAAVLSFALLPLDGGAIHPPTMTAVIAVLILGIAGTGLAYVLNYALLTAEGPTATSLVAYLIPVVAAILGVVILGDQLPPLAGLGAVLVLAGVALVRRQPPTQQPP